MQQVTEQNYDAIVAGADVVLNFGSRWCAACERLDPIIEALSRETRGRIVMGKVDVGASPRVAEKLGVMGVPTLVFLRGGKPVHQFTFTGAVSKEKIDRMLATHLAP